MKEIGEKLKNAREEIGISLEEASTDLKVEESQLKNLEEGNTDSFKDIVNVIAALLPPFSFFTAPVIYVTGRIGIAVLIVSYIIQILVIIGVMRLSAKSYRNLILSDSTTPKLKTIFKSAKM